jgi:hypothetical protein
MGPPNDGDETGAIGRDEICLAGKDAAVGPIWAVCVCSWPVALLLLLPLAESTRLEPTIGLEWWGTTTSVMSVRHNNDNLAAN